jgi:hypothetical protein
MCSADPLGTAFSSAARAEREAGDAPERIDRRPSTIESCHFTSLVIGVWAAFVPQARPGIRRQAG